LPDQHNFFHGFNYTIDNKTISTKEVLLARLDKFVEVVKKEGFKKTFNISMPKVSDIFKKKFWVGFREQDSMMHGEKPYRSGFEYPFKRTSLEKGNGVTTLITKENDSVGDVRTVLLQRGYWLSKELEKAGLENPRELEL
jgi:hypothetical protein